MTSGHGNSIAKCLAHYMPIDFVSYGNEIMLNFSFASDVLLRQRLQKCKQILTRPWYVELYDLIEDYLQK